MLRVVWCDPAVWALVVDAWVNTVHVVFNIRLNPDRSWASAILIFLGSFSSAQMPGRGGGASWPDSRGVCACCLGREGLVDVGDTFFVAALVQVLQRGEVGQVGLEFVTERRPDGSGVAVRGVELSDGLISRLCDAKEELGAEHGIVLLDGHDFGFVMVCCAAFCFLWRSLQWLSLRVGVQMGAA